MAPTVDKIETAEELGHYLRAVYEEFIGVLCPEAETSADVDPWAAFLAGAFAGAQLRSKVASHRVAADLIRMVPL